MFQRRGATAEKARFRVLSFQGSQGVRLLNLTSWLMRVIRVDPPYLCVAAVVPGHNKLNKYTYLLVPLSKSSVFLECVKLYFHNDG